MDRKKLQKRRKTRRIRRKLHNVLLWTITEIAAVSIIIGGCIADVVDVWIPVTMILGGAGWLVAFNWANGSYLLRKLDEGREGTAPDKKEDKDAGLFRGPGQGV